MMEKTIAFRVNAELYDELSLIAEKLSMPVGTWCRMFIVESLSEQR